MILIILFGYTSRNKNISQKETQKTLISKAIPKETAEISSPGVVPAIILTREVRAVDRGTEDNVRNCNIPGSRGTGYSTYFHKHRKKKIAEIDTE